MKSRMARWFTALLASAFIAACGGGGGGGGGSTSNHEQNINLATAKISGVAAKGRINGGTVKVYEILNGSKGSLLKTTITDTFGNYTANIGMYAGKDVFVEVTGGTYHDEATDLQKDNMGLSVAIPNVQENQAAAITPLTAVAAEKAIALGGFTRANILAANAVVSNMIGGIDIVATQPIDATSPTEAATATDAQKEYGLILAAISKMVYNDLAEVSDIISNIVADLTDNKLDLTGMDISDALLTVIDDPLVNQTGLTAETMTIDDFIQSAATTAVSTTPLPRLRVRVVADHDSNTRLSGATVVLGDSTGAMISSAITSNGEVAFTNPPANATVTVAYGTSMVVHYDVNVSALTVSLEVVRAVSPAQAVTVTVTAPLSAAYWHLYPGQSVGDPNNNPTTVYVSSDAIQSDGNVSFGVIGVDASDNLIGYGTLLDQPFLEFFEGMGVNISLNQTNFTNVAFNMTNIPSAATYLGGGVELSRKGVDGWVSTSNNIAPPGATATLDVKTIPGVADSYYVWLYVANQFQHSWYEFGSGAASATPAGQSVDFSTFPEIPSNLAITAETTTKPTFSWTGSSTNADNIAVGFGYSALSTNFGCELLAPATRTSVVFPELPAELTPVAATGVTGFSLWYESTDVCNGYDDCNTKFDQYVSGTLSPTGYTDKSAGTVLYTQLAAPKLNKATSLKSTSISERHDRRDSKWNIR